MNRQGGQDGQGQRQLGEADALGGVASPRGLVPASQPEVWFQGPPAQQAPQAAAGGPGEGTQIPGWTYCEVVDARWEPCARQAACITLLPLTPCALPLCRRAAAVAAEAWRQQRQGREQQRLELMWPLLGGRCCACVARPLPHAAPRGCRQAHPLLPPTLLCLQTRSRSWEG